MSEFFSELTAAEAARLIDRSPTALELLDASENITGVSDFGMDHTQRIEAEGFFWDRIHHWERVRFYEGVEVPDEIVFFGGFWPFRYRVDGLRASLGSATDARDAARFENHRFEVFIGGLCVAASPVPLCAPLASVAVLSPSVPHLGFEVASEVPLFARLLRCDSPFHGAGLVELTVLVAGWFPVFSVADATREPSRRRRRSK